MKNLSIYLSIYINRQIFFDRFIVPNSFPVVQPQQQAITYKGKQDVQIFFQKETVGRRVFKLATVSQLSSSPPSSLFFYAHAQLY